MITLITGVPGAGKTLYCVDEILTPAVESGRVVYVDGIPDLLLEHQVSPDPLQWPDWAPEGALIVIDECQRIWRPEAAGRAPHNSIAELETHRHRGLDFVILTQHPNLIHSNVRRLVGRHIHLRRTSLGVYLYEWSECVTPDSSWKNALVKTKWSHPKRSFGKYKSAEIHNKVKFRLPRSVFVLGFSVLSIIGLGTYLGRSILQRMHPQAAVSSSVEHRAASVPSSGGVADHRAAVRPAPSIVLPFGATSVWLSGVSVDRQPGGSYQGVIVFEFEIAGSRAYATDEDLTVLGYRVLTPSDRQVLLFDSAGHRQVVTFEPLRDVVDQLPQEGQTGRDATQERTALAAASVQ